MAETDAMAETEESTTVLEELRVSPAAHLAEAMAEASAGGGGAVGLRERPFAVQIGVRAEPGTASARAIEAALGITLPEVVGEVTGEADGRHTVWLSPDEFLVIDVSRPQRPGETDEAEAALEEQAARPRASTATTPNTRTEAGQEFTRGTCIERKRCAA